MNIARVLYPVKVLGPGNRVGIWVCGCHRQCPGCSNPELWREKPEYEITIDQFMSLIETIRKTSVIDGFTISGGEPMNQADDLLELVKRLSDISDDILVYSGYKLEELKSKNPFTTSVLDRIAVLIDGEYIEEKNDNSRMRGSSNQKIHILNLKFDELYRKYLDEESNQIQNFTTSNGIVSVGIHRRGFTS